jgi:hypothetical protein
MLPMNSVLVCGLIYFVFVAYFEWMHCANTCTMCCFLSLVLFGLHYTKLDSTSSLLATNVFF